MDRYDVAVLAALTAFDGDTEVKRPAVGLGLVGEWVIAASLNVRRCILPYWFGVVAVVGQLDELGCVCRNLSGDGQHGDRNLLLDRQRLGQRDDCPMYGLGKGQGQRRGLARRICGHDLHGLCAVEDALEVFARDLEGVLPTERRFIGTLDQIADLFGDRDLLLLRVTHRVRNGKALTFGTHITGQIAGNDRRGVVVDGAARAGCVRRIGREAVVSPDTIDDAGMLTLGDAVLIAERRALVDPGECARAVPLAFELIALQITVGVGGGRPSDS